MRIVHINEHLEHKGGVETYLLSLIPLLRARGHEVEIVYGKGHALPDVPCHHVPELCAADAAAESRGRQRLAALLAQSKPDLCHVHQLYNVGCLDAALSAARTVVHTHDYRYLCPASTFFHRRTRTVCDRIAGPGCFAVTLAKHCMTPRPQVALRYLGRVRWVARNVDRIAGFVAPSGWVADRLRASGFGARPIATIPYFCPMKPREEPRPAPTTPNLLYVGRIAHNKGAERLVEMLAHLPAHVRGTMVGDLTPEKRAPIEALATQLGVRDRLDLHPWGAPADVARHMAAATCLVFPSMWPETLGIVGIEALSMGVPAIGSGLGGCVEWLRDGETGFVYPPKDARAAAQVALKLIDDPALAHRFALNGINLVRDRFSPEWHLERLLELYGGNA